MSFARWAAVLLLAGSVSVVCAQEADVPAAAQAAFAQGRDFEHRQQFDSALTSYRNALRQAGGGSSAVLEAIERTQLKMENYRDAAVTAAKLRAVEPDGSGRARAAMLQGTALYAGYLAYENGVGAADKNPKRAADMLHGAEAALAQGAADDPSNEPLRALHARVLAAMKRDEEASREFAACAAIKGTSAEECARARRLAEDTESARHEAAPQFSLEETLDGRKVTLDSLAGKVVLVDFWGSWCPVCRRDSDYVQSLLDSFPAEKFVLLEVDVNDPADKWRSYVADNRLEGVQTRDGDQKVTDAFHVSAFPTYVILDANGSVRFREVGARGDLRADVRKLLAEQAAREKEPRAKLKAGAE